MRLAGKPATMVSRTSFRDVLQVGRKAFESDEDRRLNMP